MLGVPSIPIMHYAFVHYELFDCYFQWSGKAVGGDEVDAEGEIDFHIVLDNGNVVQQSS